MVAEAYIRKGESHYADAIAWINILRDRAAYKVNENRGVHIDGGQAYKTNTYCAGKGGGYSADGAIYLNRTLIMNLITWKDRKVFTMHSHLFQACT